MGTDVITKTTKTVWGGKGKASGEAGKMIAGSFLQKWDAATQVAGGRGGRGGQSVRK